MKKTWSKALTLLLCMVLLVSLLAACGEKKKENPPLPIRITQQKKRTKEKTRKTRKRTVRKKSKKRKRTD